MASFGEAPEQSDPNASVPPTAAAIVTEIEEIKEEKVNGHLCSSSLSMLYLFVRASDVLCCAMSAGGGYRGSVQVIGNN